MRFLTGHNNQGFPVSIKFEIWRDSFVIGALRAWCWLRGAHRPRMVSGAAKYTDEQGQRHVPSGTGSSCRTCHLIFEPSVLLEDVRVAGTLWITGSAVVVRRCHINPHITREARA